MRLRSVSAGRLSVVWAWRPVAGHRVSRAVSKAVSLWFMRWGDVCVVGQMRAAGGAVVGYSHTMKNSSMKSVEPTAPAKKSPSLLDEATTVMA